MNVISFDLNATRVRAVRGQPGTFPLVVPLEPPHDDLLMLVTAASGSPEVGRPGLLICREQPHLVAQHFLASIDEAAAPIRRWPFQKRTLDSNQAMHLVFRRLQQRVESEVAVTLSLPPYLDHKQTTQIYRLAREVRLPVLGSISSPLATGIAAYAEFPWSGAGLLIDVDDHALWLAVLQIEDGQLYIGETHAYADLRLSQWKNRLLDALADCCIMQSRRDPRDSAKAEQALYLQVDTLMEDCLHDRTSNIVFQTANWFQHLIVQPSDSEQFCRRFVHYVVNEVAQLLASNWSVQPVTAVFITAQAALLPGLNWTLQRYLEQWRQSPQVRKTKLFPNSEIEDFGEGLIPEDESSGEIRLTLLAPEATARGAHLLGDYLYQERVPQQHFAVSVPLPEPLPLDAGPARLHFHGRNHILTDRTFTLGSRHDCDLVLSSERFLHVSPWHCEILYRPTKYYLKDVSRDGTWINDHPVKDLVPLTPGDYIRLGPDGPVLRYLGQPQPRPLITTA